MDCPKCSGECWRDEVDIGVGNVYGPWQCAECGWSEEDDSDPEVSSILAALAGEPSP